MPVNERSLANLMPFKPGDPRRMQSTGSWPGWRQALRETIGDGRELFEKLYELAQGVPQMPCDSKGEPIQMPIFMRGMIVGHEPLIVPVPPAVMKAAASELLDRAFGKPVQVVLDVTPNGDGEGEYVAASELTDDERAIVRQIAKRRMLVRQVTEAEELK